MPETTTAPGIPTPNRPGDLRWPQRDIVAVVQRCRLCSWSEAEVADFLDVLAFKGVRRVAAYVNAMTPADLDAWRWDLPSYLADFHAHNAEWFGGLR